MRKDYIITNEECREKGLDLNLYVIEDTFIPAIIYRALDITITRCCKLFDNIDGEEELEQAIANDQHSSSKVKTFKKLQYEVLWRLVFQGEQYPIDVMIDDIIAHELNLGKINSIQKGLFYKNN